MNITVIRTGLFPDRKTVEDALNYFYPMDYVYTYDFTSDGGLDERMCEELVQVIARSDRVFTV